MAKWQVTGGLMMGKTQPMADAQVRVLAPLDGTPEAMAALPYARAVAGPGAELILLTVVSVADAVVAGTGQMLSPVDGEASREAAQARAALEPAASELRDAGYMVQIEVTAGDPAERIVDVAAEHKATMIVMASCGRGALGRLIYGSVADRVGREAPVPTMIARAEPGGPGAASVSRLVVPLDGSPLAEEALPAAEAIARRLGIPTLLVRAVNPIDLMPPAIGMGEAIPVAVYEQTEQQLDEEARGYLEETAGRLRARGLTVAAQVLTGAPAAAIAEATRRGDVVVLCSHERSGVLRWFQGSVAEQLVREDESPVLLVPASEQTKDAAT